MPDSTCLKWHGGKRYLADWIVSKMAPHLTYCEPYFGGGSVLFARDPMDERLWLTPHKGVSEIINDLNRELTTFWDVLACEVQFPRFLRIVQAMPFSGVLWEDCQTILEGPVGCDDEAYRAAYFFVLNRQSLAGRMQGFTGITKTRLRRGMNNEVSAWLSAIEGLPEVHDRLKRVLILPPQPALDVIRKFDMPETLFYLDPPYMHETRATTGEYGKFEMDAHDHIELLDYITAYAKAKVMISGYHSETYDVGLHDWNCHEFKVPVHAAGGKHKRTAIECLWTNY